MNARSLAPFALSLLACRPRAATPHRALTPDAAPIVSDASAAPIALLPEPRCESRALRPARTVCGATLLCPDNGRVQRLADPISADSVPCLQAMYAVERALEDGLARAEQRALRALAPLIDSAATTPAVIEDRSCEARPLAVRTRLQNTARTRALAWALREGFATPSAALAMYCPAAQGPALVSVAFEARERGATRAFWRVDSQGATLLLAIDPRELRGAAWINLDAEPAEELLLYTRSLDGSAARLRALSLTRTQPIELIRSDGPAPRLLVVRDEGAAVVLLDWIAHRWTGSALTPIAQPSLALRRTLALRSAVIDARASARDALVRVPVDAEALDDALAVAGMDEPAVRATLGALR